MLKPDFVTFTGLDEKTDPASVLDLSRRYPVEWGILFSPTRTGKHPRYPSLQATRRFYGIGLKLSAHLCGDHARVLLDAGEIDDALSDELFETIERVQFNLGAEADHINVRQIEEEAARLAEGLGNDVAPIVQWTDPVIPTSTRTFFLFDQSGGKGERPDKWGSPQIDAVMVGYAGGITPQNVIAVLSEIAETHPANVPFWIDMESGVRSGDYLDIGKCEDVLRAVYG